MDGPSLNSGVHAATSICAPAKQVLITRLTVFTARLLEPSGREPIGLLTQSLLEKCHEKSRNLSCSRSKCASRHGCFRCTAFRRCISYTGQKNSKVYNGF